MRTKVSLALVLIAVAGLGCGLLWSVLMATKPQSDAKRFADCKADALRSMPGALVVSYEYGAMGNDGGFPGEIYVFARTSTGLFRQSIYWERKFSSIDALRYRRCWLPFGPRRVTDAEFRQYQPTG
jgi:hypothetical protein